MEGVDFYSLVVNAGFAVAVAAFLVRWVTKTFNGFIDWVKNDVNDRLEAIAETQQKIVELQKEIVELQRQIMRLVEAIERRIND